MIGKVALVMICVVLAGPAEAVSYTFTDLGRSGDQSSAAYAINDHGQVTGYYDPVGTASQSLPFIYSGGTRSAIDPAIFANQPGSGNAINNNMQVAGGYTYYYSYGTPENRAFLAATPYTRTLGTGAAFGINDAGQVVGYYDPLGSSSAHPVLYSGITPISSGTTTDLGTLGGSDAVARDINNVGQIVGYSDVTGDRSQHAFLYNGGTMTDLGTLGGNYSFAYAINDGGLIIGSATSTTLTSGNYLHAFLYDSTIHDLGTLGGLGSVARGINEQGQIVGYSSVTDGSLHAFVYSGGTMSDLNTLVNLPTGWNSLDYAYGINASGQIVGYGDFNGNARAYLLTPTASDPDPGTGAVPEPATWAMTLLGFGLTGAALRRNAGRYARLARV